MGTHADGSENKGHWQQGKEDGQGTLTEAGGKKYVGQWVHGKKHGHGTEYDASGAIVLQGRWSKGEFQPEKTEKYKQEKKTFLGGLTSGLPGFGFGKKK